MDAEWERIQELCDEIAEPTRLWDAVGFCFVGLAGGAALAALPLIPNAEVVESPAPWLLPTFAIGAAASLVIGVLALVFAHKTRGVTATGKSRLRRELTRVERGWAAHEAAAGDADAAT